MNREPGAGAFLMLVRRWLKFNTVGAMGIVVQLATLSVLAGVLGIHYLVATAIAVETAIVHNFLWHEHWTWFERSSRVRRLSLVLGRFVRFSLGNGMISLISNLDFV